MSNPHVEWLEYELKSRWGFENPPPLNWETPVFSANLNGGTLRIGLKEHFPTIESARTAIEAFLQDWEIEVALTHGQREMAFVFKGSHIIDRDPPAPGVAVIFGAAATIQCAGSISAVGTVSLKSYPPVPYNFRAAPDVITLWTRFEGLKKGREPLASMAYFCFTVLKNSFGGVDAASKALAVDRNVLRKLSELSTNRRRPRER